MILTLEELLKEPKIISAIIDRTMQTRLDTITWQRYLTPHRTMSETFKTYFGTVRKVAAGTQIERLGKKPLRKRKNLGSGTLEVGTFGDMFQMDLQLLEDIHALISKYNETQDSTVINEIVNYLADDFRQVLMAPMVAIDRLIGDARSRGIFHININESEGHDVELPIRREAAKAEDMKNIVTWISDIVSSHQSKYGNNYTIMQMTRNTFNQKFIKSSEFRNTFALTMGKVKINPAMIVTTEMANTLLSGAGINAAIEIVDEHMELSDGTQYDAFKNDVISLLPDYNLGTMEFYQSLEWVDPVPNKTYTIAHGGAVLISTSRTEEGRFTEYIMNAIPNIKVPQKMAILDVSAPVE